MLIAESIHAQRRPSRRARHQTRSPARTRGGPLRNGLPSTTTGCGSRRSRRVGAADRGGTLHPGLAVDAAPTSGARRARPPAVSPSHLLLASPPSPPRPRRRHAGGTRDGGPPPRGSPRTSKRSTTPPLPRRLRANFGGLSRRWRGWARRRLRGGWCGSTASPPTAAGARPRTARSPGRSRTWRFVRERGDGSPATYGSALRSARERLAGRPSTSSRSCR